MNKIELSKLLGLEESCMPDTEVFIDNVELYGTDTDAGFCVGDKYFIVEGKSVGECWEKAAGKFLTDLVKIATVGYSNKAMREQRTSNE